MLSFQWFCASTPSGKLSVCPLPITKLQIWLIDLKNKYPKIVSSDSFLRAVGQPDKICYPWLLLLATADGRITQGCTVEPVEERNCEVCDMMCGLEATLGFELYRDSVKFWNRFNILSQVDIDLCPDWALRLGRINRK